MKIDAITGLAVGGFALALVYTINRNRAPAPMLASNAAPRGTFDAQTSMQADATAAYRDNTAGQFFNGTGAYRPDQAFFNGTGVYRQPQEFFDGTGAWRQ